jgi:hypothetical protein
MARTWHGREVRESKGRISNLRGEIPSFGRWPFGIEDNENEYLDLIARKPHGDGKHIPVAAVSKQYNFVEHHEMLDSVLAALGNHVDNPQSLEAELRISKYGARMWITFLLPNWKFDPGDGYPVVLQVNCLNSVDTSIAVRIHLSWHRERSDTEMQGRELRRIHDLSFKTKEIKEFLTYQFHRFSREESLYKKWYKTKLDWNSVVTWINKAVAEKWGNDTAARVYHIAKTGNDTMDEVPSLFTPEVPGLFTPVENVYHASQVLSWIASQQGTIESQLTRLGQIRGLMDNLLKQERLPVTLRPSREYKNYR